MEEQQSEVDIQRKNLELNAKLNSYYLRVKNSKVHLADSKKKLDASEYKLLLLMLQMRGQFNNNGVPMVTKETQTELYL